MVAVSAIGFCCTCDEILLFRLRIVSRHSLRLDTFINFDNLFFFVVLHQLSHCFNVGRF